MIRGGGSLVWLAVVCLALAAAGPALAKNDIRGVVTGRPLDEALDTLELDGARCGRPDGIKPVVCAYDSTTQMTLYFGARSPHYVETLVYRFRFADLRKMRDRLQSLYGLKRSRIEGEHRLFTGERFLVELDPRGTGRLSIVNEDQAREDQLGR